MKSMAVLLLYEGIGIKSFKLFEKKTHWTMNAWSNFNSLEVLNKLLTVPKRNHNRLFSLSSEAVFSMTGQGTVVTSKVERKVWKLNDTTDLLGFKKTKISTVIGLELSQKVLNIAGAEYNARIF